MEQAKSQILMEEIRKLWRENIEDYDCLAELLDLVKQHFKAGNIDALDFLRCFVEDWPVFWDSHRDDWYDWFTNEGFVDPRYTIGIKCTECGAENIMDWDPDWYKGYEGMHVHMGYMLSCGHTWSTL